MGNQNYGKEKKVGTHYKAQTEKGPSQQRAPLKWMVVSTWTAGMLELELQAAALHNGKMIHSFEIRRAAIGQHGRPSSHLRPEDAHAARALLDTVEGYLAGDHVTAIDTSVGTKTGSTKSNSSKASSLTE